MPHALQGFHKSGTNETHSRHSTAHKAVLEPASYKRRAKPRDDERAIFAVVLGSALVMILALGRMFGWEIFGGQW